MWWLPQLHGISFLKKQMTFLFWELIPLIYYLKNKLFLKQQESETIQTKKNINIEDKLPQLYFILSL